MRFLAALLVVGCTGGVPWEAPDGAGGDVEGGLDLVPDAGPETAPPVPPASPPEEATPEGPRRADPPPAAGDPDPDAAPEAAPEPEPEVVPMPDPGEIEAPGDKPGQAAALQPGVDQDGEIVAGVADYWRVDVQGPWRIDLSFSHDQGDLDVFVWDVIGSRRKTDQSGRAIGSDSDDDDEEFVFRLPAVIRVQGWEGATARYRIRLTAL